MGITSHDGAERRGTEKNRAPGAGKRRRPSRGRDRGERSSNGPETEREPSYPLAQGGDKEETSPTEATEKEATEVRHNFVSRVDRGTERVWSGLAL